MKTQIKKSIRIAALIITVTLLSLIIATTLVACDENNDNSGNNSDSGSSGGAHTEHSLGNWEIATPATCTVNGSKERFCSECDYKESEIIPASHSFNDWTIIAPATCTENGEKKKNCELCGYYETAIITASGHNFIEGTCENCGEREEGDSFTLPQSVTFDELITMLLDGTISSFSLNYVDESSNTTYTFEENMFYTFQQLESEEYTATAFNYIFEENGWYYNLLLFEDTNEMSITKSHNESNSVSTLRIDMLNTLFRDADIIITDYVNNGTYVEFVYESDFTRCEMRLYDFNIAKAWELPAEFENYQDRAIEED